MNISYFPSGTFSAGLSTACQDPNNEPFRLLARIPYFEHQVKKIGIRAFDTLFPLAMFPAPLIFLTFSADIVAAYNTYVALWILSPNVIL